jgi:tetratricopeptide (TPR) repeat protein
MVKVCGGNRWRVCLLALAAFGVMVGEVDASFMERTFGSGNRAYKHARRAHQYSEQGDLTNALKQCDLAISADANYEYAYGLRAACYSRVGNDELALADCNRAIQLGTSDSHSYELRSRLLVTKGDMTNALVDCESAIRLAPDRGYAHSMKGWIFLVQQKHDLARASLNLAINIEPGHGEWYLWRSATYQGADAFEIARDDIEKARELGCEDRQSELMLLSLAGRSGRVKEVLEACDTLLKSDPDDVEVLNTKAYALCTARDDEYRNGEDALRLAKRAVELCADRSKIPHILDTLACAYAECGQFDKAVEVQREALAGLPHAVIMKRHLVLFESGQPVREPPEAVDAEVDE